MFFKLSKLKIKLSITKILLLFFVFSCIVIITPLINRNLFSSQENVLYENLMQELVTQGICTKKSTCAEKIHFYRRSGNRIYFNMYSQKDMDLIAKISKFLVTHGIKLSQGKPITLNVYATPKTSYLDSDHYFDHEDPLLTLEIEK